MEEQNIENQLNIELSEEVAEGIYSNLAVITHSNSEFVLDFIRVMSTIPYILNFREVVSMLMQVFITRILVTKNKLIQALSHLGLCCWTTKVQWESGLLCIDLYSAMLGFKFFNIFFKSNHKTLGMFRG